MFDHLKNIDCSKGAIKGHFAANIIINKIMDTSYWWPTLFKDTHEFSKSCDNYYELED
jgi:hypothetical protein